MNYNYNYTLNRFFSYKVIDKPIRGINIDTVSEKVKLHRICVRSSKNKMICVDISTDTIPRHKQWIRFGSDFAKSLDSKRVLYLW